MLIFLLLFFTVAYPLETFIWHIREQHFQDKLFIGLKTPKVLFGIMDSKVRAAAIEQAVQFARAVGRIRKSARRGVTKLSDRQLLMLGIASNKNLYELRFPHISEIDELRKWTTEKLKAEVAKIYRMDTSVPMTDEYILKNYAGVADEDIATLLAAKPEDIKKSTAATAKSKEGLALRTSASTGIASTGVTGAQPKKTAAEQDGNGEDHEALMGILDLAGQLKELVDLELGR